MCTCHPAADANVLKVPDGMDDLDAVLLTDILPTAWHATEMGEVGPGDVVAIWGAGPGGDSTTCTVAQQAYSTSNQLNH
jgi:threonine dehydrogenase-like Zn-dependent dehydrogenase